MIGRIRESRESRLVGDSGDSTDARRAPYQNHTFQISVGDVWDACLCVCKQ